MLYTQEVLDHPPFQIHLEPESPIELPDLLRCLGAINHQFEVFAANEGISSAKEAKLLVFSVRPGSIDIGLLPDMATLGTIIAPVLVYSSPILKFFASMKALIDAFRKKAETENMTVRDCSDAIAIARPMATSGGTQTFNIYNGHVYSTVLTVTADEAKKIVANASQAKALLEGEATEIRQRVPLVWHGLDKDEARASGKRSPDKAIIEEIDPKPKSVFFEDDFASTKRMMVDDQANPYTKVFFVDVAVSRVAGKVVSYRIVGYHGDADLDD